MFTREASRCSTRGKSAWPLGSLHPKKPALRHLRPTWIWKQMETNENVVNRQLPSLSKEVPVKSYIDEIHQIHMFPNISRYFPIFLYLFLKTGCLCKLFAAGPATLRYVCLAMLRLGPHLVRIALTCNFIHWLCHMVSILFPYYYYYYLLLYVYVLHMPNTHWSGQAGCPFCPTGPVQRSCF